jgi:hypothetical protein
MSRRVAGAAGLGALLFTVGCGTSQTAPAAAVAAAPQTSTPVVVSCEPNQRTLVRPAVVNGSAVSQVECVTTGDMAVAAQNAVAQPMPVNYYTPAAAPARLPDTQYVQAPTYPVARSPRVVPARQVVYDNPAPVREVRRGRSVKKSAIIIGSSAGIGAGVGAAVGGKKGGLIGAAIGGGGAAIWDQMTRRNDR